MKHETYLYYDISFVMSAKKCQLFLFALVASGALLVSYSTLSNGYPDSKHEFVARIAVKSLEDLDEFNKIFNGNVEQTETIGD
jgi:hypothetical protein